MSIINLIRFNKLKYEGNDRVSSRGCAPHKDAKLEKRQKGT